MTNSTTRQELIATIKGRMEMLGISQQQLAADTGLSRSNLNRVLSNKYAPTLDTLLKIADALGLEISIAPLDTDNA